MEYGVGRYSLQCHNVQGTSLESMGV